MGKSIQQHDFQKFQIYAKIQGLDVQNKTLGWDLVEFRKNNSYKSNPANIGLLSLFKGGIISEGIFNLVLDLKK